MMPSPRKSSLFDYFLKKQFPLNKNLRELKRDEFTASKQSEKQFIVNYYLQSYYTEEDAEKAFSKLMAEYNRKWIKRKAIPKWIGFAAGIIFFIAIIFSWSFILALFGHNRKNGTDDNSRRLYCITPSGFFLHSRPGDSFVKTGKMFFGDTATNQMDTIQNTWIKIWAHGAMHYAPMHYMKPYGVYKAIDSLYPAYRFSWKYEDIHSKIAIRVVDIIRNTLQSNMEEWQIPFNSIPTLIENQEKAVLAIPTIIDSVHLPGEIWAFEKYHYVLLRKRNADSSGLYSYYLLDFVLGQDAEVVSSGKHFFNDPSPSCKFLIKDANGFRKGLFLRNVFLLGGSKKTLANLGLRTEKNGARQTYWNWLN